MGQQRGKWECGSAGESDLSGYKQKLKSTSSFIASFDNACGDAELRSLSQQFFHANFSVLILSDQIWGSFIYTVSKEKVHVCTFVL